MAIDTRYRAPKSLAQRIEIRQKDIPSHQVDSQDAQLDVDFAIELWHLTQYVTLCTVLCHFLIHALHCLHLRFIARLRI